MPLSCILFLEVLHQVLGRMSVAMVYHVAHNAKSMCLEHLKMCFFTVQKVMTFDHESTRLQKNCILDL